MSAHRKATPLEWLCLVALIIAAVMSTIAITTADRANRNSRAIATLEQRLHDAALGQCQRVQDLRNRVNVNSRELSGVGLVLTRVIAEPSLLAALTPADRQARIQAVRYLASELGALRSETATNCTLAVEHPLRYKRPPASPIAPPNLFK